MGALWRSKRAVIVGDPMQIEPVFTVPIRLIDALARQAGLDGEVRVAPYQVSVQNLADDASFLGTNVPVRFSGSAVRCGFIGVAWIQCLLSPTPLPTRTR